MSYTDRHILQAVIQSLLTYLRCCNLVLCLGVWSGGEICCFRFCFRLSLKERI